MTAAFDAAFLAVIGVEGGLSLDPADRGNWTGGQVGLGTLEGTKYGISAAAYPKLDIANLTIDDARAIYQAHYWVAIKGDQLPPALALLTFDGAVNQGIGATIRALQRALGVTDDGVIGPVTIAAAQHEPVEKTTVEICARRAVSYGGGSQFNTFGLGWMRRLFRIAAIAHSLTAKD
jgi:lysozyme family protein